jgi:hypothetical protein
MARLFRRLGPALELGWTLRPVESADIVLTQLGDGRREIRIDHAPLTGVTTEMLEWWFQNFDGLAVYRGRALPAYHLWHPRDHVAVTFNRNAAGRVEPGQALYIEEVFGRDQRYEVDVRSVIHRWDRRGIGFHHDAFGHRVVELDHVFTDTAAGVIYRSCMRVGSCAGPLKAVVNMLAHRRFSSAMTTAWIRHNVEEVGCFVDFLPELFAASAITHPGV